MRLVIQRVSEASVSVHGRITGAIKQGLLIFVGVEAEDNEDDLIWLAGKVSAMRLFADAEGKMNLSVQDVGGEILVVSQFTLYASSRKGNRPSFTRAGPPELAETLYQSFVARLESTLGGSVKCGVFAADMKVSLLNDGPVTILMDSKNRE